eukprot:2675532-Pleurochrysis_carterae.AAC.3
MGRAGSPRGRCALRAPSEARGGAPSPEDRPTVAEARSNRYECARNRKSNASKRSRGRSLGRKDGSKGNRGRGARAHGMTSA